MSQQADQTQNQIFSPELWQDIEVLIEEVQNCPYLSFKEEIDEVRAIVIALEEVPEEAVADLSTYYAWIQAHRSRVTSILIEIRQEVAVWKGFKYRALQLYRKGKNRILSTDEDVKKLRNKELQEAAVQEKIPEIADLLEVIKYRIDTFEDVLDLIGLKRDEIMSADIDLSRQQNVLELLLKLNYPLVGRRKLRFGDTHE